MSKKNNNKTPKIRRQSRQSSFIKGMPALPERFLQQMERLLGPDEARQLADALDESPSVSIRVNRRKVQNPEKFIKRFAAFNPTPVPWCKSGFYLDRRPDFIHDPLLHAGCYYVQEAASMIYEDIVSTLLPVSSVSKVNILDLCAAPGGKTTAILNALVPKVLHGEISSYTIVANELDPHRAKILKENLDKWGDPDIIVTNSPTSHFAHLDGVFDIVAVDAPCSGEGMMRRESVARNQWSENLVTQCSALQKEILKDALKTLKPGGILIFSTCTFNEKEDEDNVEWLKENFALQPLMSPRHFLPHRERCEGLFIGAFRKPSPLPVEYSNQYGNLTVRLKKTGIKIISQGTEKTVMKGSVETPSSRKVLAYDFDKEEFPLVELNKEEAISYLRRNSLILPEDTPLGYVTVCHEGYPLGLVKNVGSRANNLYPPEWRVVT